MANGADPGEQIAAVLAVGDEAFTDAELQEQVLQIGTIVARRRDDGDLRRERVGAPDAVDLTRVGRAHDPQQELVAFGRISGEIVAQEVGTLRRAASHDHAAHPIAHGGQSARCRQDCRQSG